MCIRDRVHTSLIVGRSTAEKIVHRNEQGQLHWHDWRSQTAVSYTHLRAHETVLDLVCRLLLEKKKNQSRHIHVALSHTTTPTDSYLTLYIVHHS